MIWGMSATLGNLDEAMRVLLGPRAAGQGALVEATIDKPLVVDTLLPESARALSLGRPSRHQDGCGRRRRDRGGEQHARLHQRPLADRALVSEPAEAPARTGRARSPSITARSSRETRDWVEQGLKSGTLKAVVCTSSLDLGVDFLPVERVLQIGSPKGVARLLQRAGRSGHAPGRVSRVTIVPSHSLELIEAAAVKAAIAAKRIESRKSLDAPLDVLAQHCVTVALGGGFAPDELLAEVRTTAAYENLTDEVVGAGASTSSRRAARRLKAYPGFRRVVPGKDGVWRVVDRDIAHRHRLNIGAIVSDAAVIVQYGPAPRGAKLGTVEESFVARLRAGAALLVRRQDPRVRAARGGHGLRASAAKGGGATPVWAGGRMPLSTTLADAMVEAFARAANGDYDSPELEAARPDARGAGQVVGAADARRRCSSRR